MRTSLLLLLFIIGFANAQIVNIPDANFKNKLLAATNTAMIAGNLPTYPTSGNYCVIDTNGDGQIQLAEAQAITLLNISYSNISSLQGIESFTNLKWLIANNNNLSSINVLSLTQLTSLGLSANLLTGINISTLSQLQSLGLSMNSITAINLSECPNLTGISIDQNSLSTIDLSQNPLLQTAFLGQNNLTSLNISVLPQLVNLMIDGNSITSLDMSNNSNIKHLSTGNNPLMLDISNMNLTSLYCYGALNSKLDFSHCTNMTNFGGGGPFLEYVFMKNGRDESFSVYNCPNLKFVCADDSQLANVQTSLNTAGLTTVVANSYCFFTPGGNYNTITGNIRFDQNGNGCDAADIAAQNIRINLTSTPLSGATFANASGYSFYTGVGNHTLTPQLEHPEYFNITPPSATANFPLLDNSTLVRDFCLTANGSHPDMEIILLPLITARPGFDARYQLVFKNKGNQILSGQVSVEFEGDKMDFVSASTAMASQTPNLLVWNYSNLLPFGVTAIDFWLAVHEPTDTPPVNEGDVLHFNAAMNAVVGDSTPYDNHFVLDQTVVNSLDPNNKTCLEGEFVTPEKIGQYLHYNINFENIGTTEATNIVVKDLINTDQFDLSTLQVQYASHPVRVLVTGNKVEFVFENINLPPSAVNPIGGHGNVLFKIKTLPTLQAGDIVTNVANIYFDYNHPIETNEARTTFALLSNAVVEYDDTIGMYPNPAKNFVQINANSAIQTIEIFDMGGRILQHTSENKKATTIDGSGRSNGIYFVKITTEKGSSVKKLVKE